MSEIQLEILEDDPRFPSGQWTGFFLQYWMPGRHKTDSELTWAGGELSGTGSDWVGKYTIAGQYDVHSGECWWTKQYTGKHAVFYKGVNEGRGIWGVWELPQMMGLFTDKGGFHIWPAAAEVSGESDEAEQTLIALMRKEFGSRFVRVMFYLAIIGIIAAGAALWLHIAHG